MNEEDYIDLDFQGEAESYPKGSRSFMIEYIDYKEDKNGKLKWSHVKNQRNWWDAANYRARKFYEENRHEEVIIRRVSNIH